MLELRVIRVLYNCVKKISVDIIGIISEEPRNKLDTVELYVEDFRVNNEVAINLRVLVNVFLLAYSDILIEGRELFRVGYNSVESVSGQPSQKGARKLFDKACLYLDLLL